jgi:4'-phosphopantetheinyl transferase
MNAPTLSTAPGLAPRGPVKLGSRDLGLARQVSLWRVGLDEPGADWLRYLPTVISRDEVERAGRFHFARDRQRFIVGRGILRVLLGRFVNDAPEGLRFSYSANGKPALVRRQREGALHFNLSHSAGVAVFAFSQAGPLGVDIEHVRELEDWEQVAAMCFSAGEIAALHAARPESRTEQFFRAWTKHEARLKAAGDGLGGSDYEGHVPSGLFSPGNRGGIQSARLCIHTLNPGPGLVGALAVGPEAQTAVCTTWPVDTRTFESVFTRECRRESLESDTETFVSFP